MNIAFHSVVLLSPAAASHWHRYRTFQAIHQGTAAYFWNALHRAAPLKKPGSGRATSSLPLTNRLCRERLISTGRSMRWANAGVDVPLSVLQGIEISQGVEIFLHINNHVFSIS